MGGSGGSHIKAKMTRENVSWESVVRLSVAAASQKTDMLSTCARLRPRRRRRLLHLYSLQTFNFGGRRNGPFHSISCNSSANKPYLRNECFFEGNFKSCQWRQIRWEKTILLNTPRLPFLHKRYFLSHSQETYHRSTTEVGTQGQSFNPYSPISDGV